MRQGIARLRPRAAGRSEQPRRPGHEAAPRRARRHAVLSAIAVPPVPRGARRSPGYHRERKRREASANDRHPQRALRDVRPAPLGPPLLRRPPLPAHAEHRRAGRARRALLRGLRAERHRRPVAHVLLHRPLRRHPRRDAQPRPALGGRGDARLAPPRKRPHPGARRQDARAARRARHAAPAARRPGRPGGAAARRLVLRGRPPRRPPRRTRRRLRRLAPRPRLRERRPLDRLRHRRGGRGRPPALGLEDAPRRPPRPRAGGAQRNGLHHRRRARLHRAARATSPGSCTSPT